MPQFFYGMVVIGLLCKVQVMGRKWGGHCECVVRTFGVLAVGGVGRWECVGSALGVRWECVRRTQSYHSLL